MDRLADIGKAFFIIGALMLAIGLIMPLFYIANVTESTGTAPDLTGYPFFTFSTNPLFAQLTLLGILLCVAGPALYACSKLADLEGRSYSIRKNKKR